MLSKLTTKHTLPSIVLRTIEGYTSLSLGGKKVIAPYFMNEPGRRGRRVSVGKGTAKELENETKRLAKKFSFNLDAASAEQIRNFMVDHKLGIDCSGLVAWASHAFALENSGRSLWSGIVFNGNPIRVRIAKHLRPVENISARLLTDKTNANTIHDLLAVRPGDIVRSLNGNHVLLIVEVGRNKQKDPVYFKYVNSTEFGGVKYGVRYGLIKISDPAQTILEQDWVDGENGINWVFNAANNYPDDTRIVRLKALNTSHISTMQALKRR